MSGRRLLAIAHKEWLHVRRDPRSLGVAVLMPLVLLVLMGVGVNFDLQTMTMVLCDLDGSASSRALRDELANIEMFDLVDQIYSPAEGETMVRDGRCLFMIVIPSGMARDIARGRTVTIQMLLDGADSNTATAARGYVNGAVAGFSGRLQLEAAVQRTGGRVLPAPPIQVFRRVLYNPSLQSRHFIVPGLMVLILIILGAMLTSGTIVGEKERGSFEALAASPAQAGEIILGKAIPYTAIGILDIALAVITGALVFHVYVAGSVALLLACGIVFMACALGLGLFFSTVLPTQQLAMLATFITTFLPATLLSGFIYPIQNMPWVLQAVSKVIPATHFLILARGIYLKGVGLEVLWPQLAILTAFATIVIGAGVKQFRKRL